MKNHAKFIVILALTFVLVSGPVGAAPREAFSIPARAVEVSNGVWSLGTAYDVDSDSLVEGYAIVHKKGNAKGGNVKPPKGGGPTCYGFLASGAKWKTVEPWESFGGPGLDAFYILTNTAFNIDKWEAAAGADILGEGTLGAGIIGDPYALDEQNQVSFGDLGGGTIAVTVVWGVFTGPVSGRVLVAWDQIYNTDYAWSSTGEAGKMDYENISTHELGHSVGLADIYNASCGNVTMYGYANYGETNKRTLEEADMLGVSTLY